MPTICECCGQPIRQRAAAKICGPKFKAYEDFSPAHLRAKLAACAELGTLWALQPGASVIARLPAAWVACKVFGRVSRSPRDVRMPASRFWPNGLLPIGPDYASEGPRAAPFVAMQEAA